MKKHFRYFGVAFVALLLLAGSVTINTDSSAMLASRMTMGAAGAAGGAVYGVDWDEDLSSPTLTRTGDTSGEAAAAALSNSDAPIQALMKRCILQDNGTVNYYLCATDSTKKENCSTASVLDGTDGQVMVEIPSFWYLYEYDSGTNIHSWSISLEDQGGDWIRHPAFYKDGAWVAHRYIGAYEGIWEDNGTYKDGVSAVGGAGDKLGSVSGFASWTDDTRAQFRAWALARGTGWRQQDFYLTSAVQLLYLVEYASFYSQSVIGMGRTELTGGTYVKDSYIGVTGKSNGDGNATGNTGGNTNDAYMSYRGIENFYGNITQWIDGFNINGGIPYVSNTEAHFADATDSNYTRLTDTGGSGITLPPESNDYPTTLEQTKGGFLPSAVGGSSSTYITDLYHSTTGWRVARLGGDANDGSKSGFFYWRLTADANVKGSDIGSRLSY